MLSFVVGVAVAVVVVVVVVVDVVERPSFLGRVLLVVVLCCLYFCWCLMGWSTVGHSGVPVSLGVLQKL